MRKLVVAFGALLLLTALTACGGETFPTPVLPASALGAGAQARGALPEPQAIYPAGINTPTPAPEGFFMNRPEIGLAPTPHVAPSGNYAGVTVTRADFGDQWPFNVESGVAECVHRSALPVLKVGGEEYPLTGLRMFALADPFDIWLDDPNNPGEKMSMSPVRVVALAECDLTRMCPGPLCG